MLKLYIMKCGHVVDEKHPKCDLCNCTTILREVMNNTDGLENRKARCCQHKTSKPPEVPSRWDLPFFNYRPDKDFDEYYCGCWGWE